ncbi:MAG TPA: hypothetical protein VNT28_03865 [Candidatus Limnocylindrales bacterium]|jgi:N-acetylneuraminic acid mutarotase|nr:hypothetical protein [Candidatus Limnocylindrales bacterium]
MAQHALPPGAVRRRTAFGLFDADGWTWATIKAAFWFFTIIFLLGYVPDRAYYFTVSPTIDVGYNVISPVNWCDARNQGLPCPAPAGAVVPWIEGGEGITLPAPRAGAAAFNVSENIYLVGGRGADGTATATVMATALVDDNLTGWQAAADLPAPRADAVAVVAAGSPYVIGGLDEAGNPTSTVFRGILEEGTLSGWEEAAELQLPVAVASASAVGGAGGIYVFGGLVDGQPSSTVYLAALEAESTTPDPWVEMTELPLPEPRAAASAVLATSFVYVMGGVGPDGVSNLVFFLELDADGAPVQGEGERPQGWGVSVGSAASFSLPEPRANHFSFSNAGSIYAIGGEDAQGQLAMTNYWAVPDVDDGTIPAWNRLEVSDLPAGRADAGVIALGSYVYAMGGETQEGVTDSVLRANVAPGAPFFRLGLFGLTVPGLGIPGEVGQQLGYLAAAGAGTTMFILLVLIGIAYSHPRGTMRVIERVSRGRFRAPPEEDDLRS